MNLDERYEKKEAFLDELRELLWKTVGTKRFNEADSDLLYMLQDCTSLFQPYMWPED
jgi:hypothetical protein